MPPSFTVIVSDCATGRDFESEEPTFIPQDEVFSVAAGTVHELVTGENESELGRHVLLAHRWPVGGEPFYSVYAHLAAMTIGAQASVIGGQRIGIMGQTSCNAAARNWMAIAPHLHFEVRDAAGNPYNPEAFLRRYLPRRR